MLLANLALTFLTVFAVPVALTTEGAEWVAFLVLGAWLVLLISA